MLRTVQARIDRQGRVTLKEGVSLPRDADALVTILQDEAELERLMPALLSERSLAEDWSTPAEDAAWAHLDGLPALGDEEKA